jgi:hypothetical protein
VTDGVKVDDGVRDGVPVGVAVSVSVVVGVPELGAVLDAVAPGRSVRVGDALTVPVTVEDSVDVDDDVSDPVLVPVLVPVGVGVGCGVRDGVRVVDLLSLDVKLGDGDGVGEHVHANGAPTAGTAKLADDDAAAEDDAAADVVACGFPYPSSFPGLKSATVGVADGVRDFDGVRVGEHVHPPSAAAVTVTVTRSKRDVNFIVAARSANASLSSQAAFCHRSGVFEE